MLCSKATNLAFLRISSLSRRVRFFSISIAFLSHKYRAAQILCRQNSEAWSVCLDPRTTSFNQSMERWRYTAEKRQDMKGIVTLDWLPVRNRPRTNSYWATFEDEGKLFMHFERRQPVFLFEPREDRTRRSGLKRRWIRNPVVIAKEILAAAEQEPGITYSVIATRRGVSRARISQYLRLLRLPAEIIDFMVNPENEARTSKITEGALRILQRLPSNAEKLRGFWQMLQDKAETAGTGSHEKK